MDNDTTGTTRLHTDSAALFEDVFKSHFKQLHIYACTILKDEAVAEEVVQNVFVKLWEKREQIEVQQSLTAYLYRSVHNESLNYLKHIKVRTGYKVHVTHTQTEAEHGTDPAQLKELQQRINKALNELPEQCRTVFQLSRFEDMKYRTIAERLGISVKTVEKHMGKALSMLRIKLADLLPVVGLLIVNLKNLLP